MNTSKQIMIMVALIFISLIATGAYTLWDPTRASEAEDRQLDKTLERAAYLFAHNCRVCHGDAGEGGAEGNRLGVAPPLNRPDLQGEVDGSVDPVAYADAYNLVFNTITCGRIGTAMPAWANAQGGPLNNEQIKQLTILITHGEPGWDYAVEEADHEDNALGLTLAEGISGTATEVVVSDAELLGPGSRLEIGDELMLISEVNKETDTVTVERGLEETPQSAHDQGATVLVPPVPPDPPSVNEEACGQTAIAQPTTDPNAPTPTPVPDAQQLTVVGLDLEFDPETLTANATQPITVTFDNQDEGVQHNIVFYDGPDADSEQIAGTDIASGAVVQTLSFGPLEAGEYYYDCQVHPTTMQGVLTVQ
jgi:plastocyanin/mono/diheme cytochrome c family protein